MLKTWLTSRPIRRWDFMKNLSSLFLSATEICPAKARKHRWPVRVWELEKWHPMPRLATSEVWVGREEIAVDYIGRSGDWCVGWGIMRERNGHQEFWHNLFVQCREAEGEWFWGPTRAVKNYFISFECVNFRFILVGPLKDVKKFCFQSGGGVLGYQ